MISVTSRLSLKSLSSSEGRPSWSAAFQAMENREDVILNPVVLIEVRVGFYSERPAYSRGKPDRSASQALAGSEWSPAHPPGGRAGVALFDHSPPRHMRGSGLPPDRLAWRGAWGSNLPPHGRPSSKSPGPVGHAQSSGDRVRRQPHAGPSLKYFQGAFSPLPPERKYCMVGFLRASCLSC